MSFCSPLSAIFAVLWPGSRIAVFIVMWIEDYKSGCRRAVASYPSFKMMCDIMPTISEDPPEIQYGQNEETNFEQLMVNMLDERDKLMETLRETQDTLALTRSKLTDAHKEREAIMAHLESVLCEVVVILKKLTTFFKSRNMLSLWSYRISIWSSLCKILCIWLGISTDWDLFVIILFMSFSAYELCLIYSMGCSIMSIVTLIIGFHWTRITIMSNIPYKIE